MSKTKKMKKTNASPFANLKRDCFRLILIRRVFFKRTVSLDALGAAGDAARKAGRAGED